MSLFAPLRQSLRSLAKTPAFTFVAVLTLAIGIGANTAMFSIMNAVLLTPLPYPEPERLVFVRDVQPQLRDLPGSFPEYLDWKTLDGVFEGVGAYWPASANLTGEGEPERIEVCRLTPSLPPLLGVEPLLGRLFEESDDLPGAEKVALVSHSLWQRRFGGDSGILGRVIRVDGEPVTVVGVLPPSERSVTPAELRRRAGSDLWLPLRATVETSPRGQHYLTVVARLAPDLSFHRAQEAIESAAKSFQDDGRTEHEILLVPVAERIAGSSRAPVLLLSGAVGLVLLIACANVANLLMARLSGRGREMAIRAALGASRSRLLVHLIGESLALAAAGGALGVLLALWGLRLFSISPGAALLRSGTVEANATVLLFALGLTVLTALLFGSAPGLVASGIAPGGALREGGRQVGVGGSRRAVTRSLVIAEFALAMMLLTGAGLLLSSLRNLRDEELGFDPSGLLTFRVALAGPRYEDPEPQASFHDRALERIRSLPGVKGAAIVTVLPVEGGWNSDFEVEGIVWPDGHSPLAETRSVSPDYFRVMGVPLLEGRLFDDSDTIGSANVAIVDRELARIVFGGESPIGRRLYLEGEDGPRREIVGVVGTVQHWSLGREERPGIYFPHRQLLNSTTMTTVVRAERDPLALVPAVREQVKAVDPDQPISQVRTMEEVLEANLAQRGFSTRLLSAFALLALGLAAIGLYGVVSQTTSERTREFGLRVALGAKAGDLLVLVFRSGGKLVLAGILFGIAGSLALTRVLSSLLFGVAASDPRVMGATALVLAGVAALSLFLPARRAARVDPILALRNL